MDGYCLKEYREDLFPIDLKRHKNEYESIENIASKINCFVGKVKKRLSSFNFENHYYRLQYEYFSKFSFDEFCKLNFASKITMHQSVGDLFRNCYQHEIIRKIENSMWRWGRSSDECQWNILVNAYNGIRNFDFGIDGFDIRLDYTIGDNDFGYSKCSRIFLDGMFAFLIYYKKEHVFTLGFSVCGDNKILINQIQAKSKKGNRFFYKLPKNRIEFVVDLFFKYFPTFDIYLVDGKSTAKNIQATHTQHYKLRKRLLDNIKVEVKRGDIDTNDESYKKTLGEYIKVKNEFKEFKEFTFKHIENVYSGKLEKYKRCKIIVRNNLKFHSLCYK